MKLQNHAGVRRLAERFEELGKRAASFSVWKGRFQSVAIRDEFWDSLQEEYFPDPFGEIDPFTGRDAGYFRAAYCLNPQSAGWTESVFVHGRTAAVETFCELSKMAGSFLEYDLPNPGQPMWDLEWMIVGVWVSEVFALLENKAYAFSPCSTPSYQATKLTLNPFEASATAIHLLLDAAQPPKLGGSIVPSQRPASQEIFTAGPHPPNLFCWDQKLHELTPIRWKVVNYLWNKRNCTVDSLELYREVWEDSYRAVGGLRSARTTLNKFFLKFNIPLILRLPGKFASLQDNGPPS